MKRIINDDRPIKSITFEDDSVFQVGVSGIDSITAYEEYGQYSMITWFSIFRNGEITQRVNGQYIATVSYL